MKNSEHSKMIDGLFAIARSLDNVATAIREQQGHKNDSGTTTSRLLNRREASQYLLDTHGIRRDAGTLAKYASIGGGPKFKKAGRGVLYDIASLDIYAKNIMHDRNSTNQ